MKLRITAIKGLIRYHLANVEKQMRVKQTSFITPLLRSSERNLNPLARDIAIKVGEELRSCQQGLNELTAFPEGKEKTASAVITGGSVGKDGCGWRTNGSTQAS